MTEYEAYREYIALKRHFNSSTFDYFKYNGRVNISIDSYKKRNDRYFFKKLAKEKDPKGLLISNFVYADAWIGDILKNQQSEIIYKKWLNVKQSISYIFEQDLKKIGNLKDAISADNSMPKLFTQYYRDEICLETLVILMDILRCCSYWSKHIKDDPLAKQTLQKIIKYKSFVKYDKNKFTKMIKSHLTNIE